MKMQVEYNKIITEHIASVLRDIIQTGMIWSVT